MDFKHILVLVFMLATFFVLVVGVGVMMIGGKINAKYGNRLMVARVSLQALTVLLIGLFLLAGK